MNRYSGGADMLEDLEKKNRQLVRRDRLLVWLILVVGSTIAVAVGYLFTLEEVGYRSIRCEEGNVRLVLERADGVIERVECPAEVSVKP